MKKHYKKIISVISVFAIVIGIIIGSNSFSANAGVAKCEIMNDDFTGSQIDIGRWLYYESGITMQHSRQVLKVSNGANGTGITTKESVSKGDGVEICLDIKNLSLGETEGATGWLGFIFGVENTNSNGNSSFDSTIAKIENKTAGLHTFTMQNGEIKYQTQYLAGKQLVDGNNNIVEDADGYKINVSNYFRNGDLENVSFKITYLNDGTFSLKSKGINEAEANYVTILKTTNDKFPSFYSGQVAMYFMESTSNVHKLDAEIYNFKVNSVNSSGIKQILSEFCSEGNVLQNYYYSVSPSSIFKSGNDSSVNFNKDYDSGYPMTARNKAYASSDINANCLTIDFDININNINGDKKFGLVYGMEKLNSDVGAKNSSFLYFTKNGNDLVYGLTVTDNAGKNSTVFSNENLGDKKKFNVKLEVDFDKTLRIYIDNVLVKTVKGGNAEGFIAFSINGAFTDANNFVNVNIDNVVINNTYYDRPQNGNISMDFSSNHYNMNEWYVKSSGFGGISSGIYIKDGKLNFNNVAQDSTFATRHKYSNFGFKFDIDDIRRETVKDEDGNLRFPVSSWIGFSFGCNREYVTDIVNFGEFFGTAPLVYFYADLDKDSWEKTSKTKIMVVNNGFYKSFDLPQKYDFWDKQYAGKVVNVYSVMKDGNFSIKLKYGDEKTYTTVLEYDFGFAPTGFIQFWGMGDYSYNSTGGDALMVGNFKFDNVVIENLDKNPNLIQIEYKSSARKPKEDYAYIDKNDDEEYLIQNYIKG